MWRGLWQSELGATNGSSWGVVSRRGPSILKYKTKILALTMPHHEAKYLYYFVWSLNRIPGKINLLKINDKYTDFQSWSRLVCPSLFQRPKSQSSSNRTYFVVLISCLLVICWKLNCRYVLNSSYFWMPSFLLSKLHAIVFYLTLLSKLALYVQISGLAIHCLVHATLSPPLSDVKKVHYWK